MSTVRPTYQQKLFADEELANPTHDAIVRWTDKLIRTRPSAVLDALRLKYTTDSDGRPCRWKASNTPNVSCDTGYATDSEKWYAKTGLWSLGPLVALEPPAPPPVLFADPEWEPILKGRNGGIAAALDLRTTMNTPVLCGTVHADVDHANRQPYGDQLYKLYGDDRRHIAILCDGHRFWREDRPETDLAAPTGLAAQVGPAVLHGGYVFRVTKFRWWGAEAKRKLIFEAKTQIRTAGELIRQLKLYETLEPEARIIVVAPTGEFRGETRDILVEQGFYVLPYLSNT